MVETLRLQTQNIAQQQGACIHNHLQREWSMYIHSLIPRPLPPRRGPVHSVCTCAKYSITISVKSFVHFLVRMQKIILTKNTEIYLNYRLQQQFNLQKPAGIILFRCDSINFPNVQSNRKVTNQFTKKARSYTVCSGTLNTIGLYNRNGAQYSLSKQQISRSCSPLFKSTNMHSSYM